MVTKNRKESGDRQSLALDLIPFNFFVLNRFTITLAQHHICLQYKINNIEGIPQWYDITFCAEQATPHLCFLHEITYFIKKKSTEVAI